MTLRRPLRFALAVLAGLSAVTLPWNGGGARAQDPEYTLETTAEYDVAPGERRVGVAVDLAFTNTTPDPEGQFSVFEELRVAIHDGAEDVAARDEEGELEVAVADDDGVNVATIELREALRFEEEVTLELDYVLVDGADPTLRIGPSLVVFPAWGFGTSSEVTVNVPATFEVRIDGDELREAAPGQLTSGPIDDPTAWLALVTAIGPADYAPFDATVALDGGTADLLVRAFADDPEWGESTRDLAVAALPLLEAEAGLPYPLIGRLMLTQGPPGNALGFGETPIRREEIVVAYDEPPFTILHQLAHVWLPTSLVDARWIREGLASDLASRVAAELDVQPPYDPITEAEELADAAMPLDAWADSSDPAADGYAYAAAWALVADLRATVGDDALRTVLARVAGSIGAYDETTLEPPPSDGAPPREPLSSRSFLDQLETVSGQALAERFAARVLTDADAALLQQRGDARAAFDELLTAADGWGAPDPVRVSMASWSFADATARIETTREWLLIRDDLLDELGRLGLSAPDRLQQAYRAYGGGPEAVDEVEAERAVVDAYGEAAERVNAPRSFLARLGLIGGPDPATHLGLANGHFADGELRAATDSISDAVRLIDGAETAGLVRLVSVVLLAVVLVGLAIAVFRRRAAYTAAR